MQQFYHQVKAYGLYFIYQRPFKPPINAFLILFLLVFTFCFPLIGQDTHFSQFHNAPFSINPGLTGIARGDIRIMGNYRGQWQNVPVDYQTYGLAADMQFIERYYKEGFFAGGIMVNYDQAGYSRLRTANVGLSGSYVKKLDPHVYASIGLQLGATQRAFNLDDLTFDTQYNDIRGVYDGTIESGEFIDQSSTTFLDVGVGFNIRFQSHDNAALVDRMEKRSKLDLGLGIAHVNMPDQSFTPDITVPLNLRISPYLMGTLKVADPIDLVGNFLAQFQSPYQEYLGMLGAKIHLSRQLGKQLAMQFDFGYRFNDEFGDSYYPGIEFFYNGWQVGFTYDINVSPFDIATNGRGGPEVSVRHIIRKVRPLPSFRACPFM